MDQNSFSICANCGHNNRGNARFCQKCGAELFSSNSSSEPAGSQGNFLNDIVDEIEGMAGDVRDAFNSLARSLGLGGGKGQNPPAPLDPSAGQSASPYYSPSQQPPAQLAHVPSRPAVPPTAPTRMITHLIAPKVVGETIGGYVVLEAWPLQHSNYYRARMLSCPQGHANPAVQSERCSVCQAELGVYLVRETDVSATAGAAANSAAIAPASGGAPRTVDLQQLGGGASSKTVDRQNISVLTQLSRSGTPGFLNLAAVFDLGGRHYSVSDYPGQGWQSLTHLSMPVADHPLLAHWAITLGQAMQKLSEAGFTPQVGAVADVLEPVVIVRQQAAFADLGMFTRQAAPGGASEAGGANPHVAYLAQVLYNLASGKQQNRHRAPRDYSDVPAPLRGLIARVDQNALPNLQIFLDALRETQKLPDSGQLTRSLRQISGYSTDVGKKRDHNEDFVGKYSLGMQQTADAAEVGLYLIADGMGGHQAGELASREVVRVIVEEIQQNVQELQKAPKIKRSTIKLDQVVSASDVLKQAVLRANEVLVSAKQKIGSDRGTTLTAAVVMGDVCAVANVGDSRTYLWRDGNLKQITKDHSLVASLLAANMIRPDEVRSHPQRNQVYRTLGDKMAVEVDLFECPLRQGDRLMLCSDGLWEMVLDVDIQQILNQASNPQEACDRLIEAANKAGGDDNISVVSVWMT